MKKKINYIIIFVFSMFLGILSVNASTYTPTTNLFEGTYSNNLIDMSQSQVDNFMTKKFVLFQVDYNYYLVVGDEYTINGNSITFTDAKVFSAVRTNSSYNSTYEYSSHNESSTTINSSYVVISNTEFSKSITSKRFNDYRNDYYTVALLTLIGGLVFAIFVTKERRF